MKESIFTLDLVLNCIDKLLVFRWVQIVLLLFLFCYERDFRKYFSNDNKAYIIMTFNSTSRYLDGLVNIGIKSKESFFQSSIADTMNWFQNSMSG